MNTGKTYKTRQRAEIEGVLRDGDCMTVRDICARLASSGANVGETTVYRTLEKMAAEGDVRRYDPGKGAAVYRLARRPPLRRACTPSLPSAAARWSIWTAALSAGWRRTSKRNTASRWTADERCCTASAAAAERSGRNETCFFSSACAASARAAAGRLHCGAGGSRGWPADRRDQLPAVRLRAPRRGGGRLGTAASVPRRRAARL